VGGHAGGHAFEVRCGPEVGQRYFLSRTVQVGGVHIVGKIRKSLILKSFIVRTLICLLET
jgi:hypothetical protein